MIIKGVHYTENGCPTGSWRFDTRADCKRFVKGHQRDGGLRGARLWQCDTCDGWHFGKPPHVREQTAQRTD